jgi:Zn-dependent peptidase ImmA (M78 family)/DNA-binding XRE family transcriptional regulator
MANVANITPKVLEWARKYNDLTRSDLADKIRVHENQITKWETGKTKPTFNQATELAHALHIPFGYLFLTSPPNLETPLPDLRTRRDRRLLKISPVLREVMYGAFDRYEWYREYVSEYGQGKLPFVGRFTTNDSPKDVAASIRKILDIDPTEREQLTTHSKYLALLTERAEAAGILVMRSSVVGNDTRRGLSPGEFQGFVITDDIAPVIFINGADFIGAEIFTLAHELAHIWIGTSGISNPNEAEVNATDHASVESFCNNVAVEVLVPEAEFLEAWEKHPKEFYQLARYFKVSTLVIERRAYELDKIGSGDFFSMLQSSTANRKPRPKGGRGDYLANVATRHSPTVMDSVIKDVRAGGTLMRDGARLLNMGLPTFARVVEGGEY